MPPLTGREAVRLTERDVGTGGGRKRRPCCNGVERDCNIIPRASEQTSLWSLGTRKRGQPLEEATASNQWAGRPSATLLAHNLRAHPAIRKQFQQHCMRDTPID